MTDRNKLIAAIYAAGFVIAFGHSAAARQNAEDAEYAACKAKQDALCWRNIAGAPAGAMMAGLLWPLYVSWEAFEHGPRALAEDKP
jgi:hypothetical protein